MTESLEIAGAVARALELSPEEFAQRFFEYGDVPNRLLEHYNTPTIRFFDASVMEADGASAGGGVETESVGDDTAADCDVFEKVDTVTTVLGVDCDAGAIEGFKDQARQLVSSEAGAELDPSHPFYRLVEAQKSGDSAAIDSEAARLAQSFDLLRPDMADESAVLHLGTQFVLDDNGTFTIVGPDGKTLAMSDCDGVVEKFSGAWIDSVDCVPCQAEEMAAIEARELEAQTVTPAQPETVTGPRIQTVEVCAAPGMCNQFESVMIFDSVEQAQEYFSHPENVSGFPEDYQDALQKRYRFFVVADGEGYAECLPFRIRGGEMQLATERMFPLEMYNENQRLVGNMTDGVAKKYFDGYVGTNGTRSTGGLAFGMTEGEVLFPSAPQEFVYDPEAGRHVLESSDVSAARTYALWVSEAGLSGDEWSMVDDMRLPEAFADPDTSVDERADALMRAMEERGVAISKEDARELTIVINEGYLGEDAGLKFNERVLDDAGLSGPAMQNGAMVRLNDALITAAYNVTEAQRAVQGF
ncbi:MAG: hypothetical protein ACE5F4_00120 [Candidatus Paceibacteria bacterium]